MPLWKDSFMSSVNCLYCNKECYAKSRHIAHVCDNHEFEPYFFLNNISKIIEVEFHLYEYKLIIVIDEFIQIYKNGVYGCILQIPCFQITPENSNKILNKLLKFKGFC